MHERWSVRTGDTEVFFQQRKRGPKTMHYAKSSDILEILTGHVFIDLVATMTKVGKDHAKQPTVRVKARGRIEALLR